VPASRKGGLRTWGAHTITIVKRTALRALRTVIVSGALEQGYYLFVMDNIRKDALLKDVPELVAFTSPTMGSELDKLKESVLSIGIRHATHPVSRSLHFEAGLHRRRRGSNMVLRYDISSTPSPTANLSTPIVSHLSCYVKYSLLTIARFSLAMNTVGMFADDTEEE